MVVDLSQTRPFNGPIERRGNSLIVFVENKKEFAKLADYFDPKVSDDEIQALSYNRATNRSNPRQARRTR